MTTGLTPGKWALLIVTVLAAGSFAFWQAVRPKLTKATAEDISHSVPFGFKVSDKRDVASMLRLTKVFAVTRELSHSYLGLPSLTNTTESERWARSHDVWIQNFGDFKLVDSLLMEGPLLYKPISDPSLDSMGAMPLNQFVRVLGMIGSAMALKGDYQTCEEAIDINLHLVSRLRSARGGFSDYRTYSKLLMTTLGAIQTASRTPNCPNRLLKKWLHALESWSNADLTLRDTLVAVYEEYTVSRLAHPQLVIRDVIRHGIGRLDIDTPFEPPAEEYEGVGTYAPAKTGPIVADLLSLQLVNVTRPMDQLDPGPNLISKGASQGLPETRGRRKSIERVRFKLQMNNLDNSIGRALIAYLGGAEPQSCFQASYHWRATLACLKVLLASVIYRIEHGGKLPRTVLELFQGNPADVPTDPFDGHPIRYSQMDESTWTIGENLRDDEGMLSSRPSISLDLGMSLEVERSKPLNQRRF